jgi:hypothetical protein
MHTVVGLTRIVDLAYMVYLACMVDPAYICYLNIDLCSLHVA